MDSPSFECFKVAGTLRSFVVNSGGWKDKGDSPIETIEIVIGTSISISIEN
jgi:hypothetical protein